jgi:KipI family sensor histidine kinase inhibitor
MSGSGSLRIDAMGESALLVTVGDSVDLGTAARARAIAAVVDADPRLGRAVPAYASVLVPFDPVALSVADARAIVEEIVGDVGAAAGASTGRLVEIPVRYGGADGPDLEDVARLHDLRPADVVEIHAGTDYDAFFLGFAPGFAYLGPVAASIATPRLDVPRPHVPAGSVAIGGTQTAVYPTATPGGWRLIGRTDAPIWDLDSDPPALILPGDRVRFVPVS